MFGFHFNRSRKAEWSLHMKQGTRLLEERRHEEAIVELAKSAEAAKGLSPGYSARSHNGLGSAHRHLKNYEQALLAYKMAAAECRDPDAGSPEELFFSVMRNIARLYADWFALQPETQLAGPRVCPADTYWMFYVVAAGGQSSEVMGKLERIVGMRDQTLLQQQAESPLDKAAPESAVSIEIALDLAASVTSRTNPHLVHQAAYWISCHIEEIAQHIGLSCSSLDEPVDNKVKMFFGRTSS